MLAYLDMLCAALIERQQEEIQRLLKHPLARALPRRVREEATAIARAGPNSLRSPIQTLRFYHQTMHLLGPRGERGASTAANRTGGAPDGSQMELPLRVAGGSR